MLKSTLLFVAIMADISAKTELAPKELMVVATEVANEEEFIGNTEIQDLIRAIPNDNILVQFKKIAYKTGAYKELV